MAKNLLTLTNSKLRLYLLVKDHPIPLSFPLQPIQGQKLTMLSIIIELKGRGKKKNQAHSLLLLHISHAGGIACI
jgi:hypothetical protein